MGLFKLDSAELTMNYDTWNGRLYGHFFNRGRRFRGVRLSVDEETLVELGGTLEDLVEAVLTKAEERQCDDVQVLGLVLYDEWELDVAKETPSKPPSPGPPVLPILALYVIAVNHRDDDLPAHAYYDRLHSLLREPRDKIKSLSRSVTLWEALGRWSKHLVGGQLGVFDLGIAGRQEYVGIPRRQSLLCGREETPLHRAFYKAGLRPGANPTDRRLFDAIKSASGLLARTRKLLAAWPADPVAQELLAEVREEFDAWDEVVPKDFDSAGAKLDVALRIALQYSGSTVRSARLETELVPGITDEDRSVSVVVPEHLGTSDLSIRSSEGALLPVVVDEQGASDWIESVSWFDAIALQVDETDVSLSRASQDYVILGKRERAQVLEELDVDDLSSNELCLLLAPSKHGEDFEPAFVDVFTSEWLDLPIARDPVFRRFRAKRRSGNDAPRTRLRLRGGIRSSPGANAYLPFALPSVEVECEAKEPAVEIRTFDERGQEIGGLRSLTAVELQSPGESIFDDEASSSLVFDLAELPPNASYVQAELRSDHEIIATRSFFVDRSPLRDETVAAQARDGFGLFVEDEAAAVTRGTMALRDWTGSIPDLPPHRSPTQWSEVGAEDELGTRLMELLRLRPRIRWSDAKAWLPRCVVSGADSTGRYFVHEVQALHALGILELEENPEGGLDDLIMLPPRIALLPRLAYLGHNPKWGLETAHEAILIGCWTSEELTDLKKACRRAAIDVKISARDEVLPLFPHRWTLVARGSRAVELLDRVATEVGVDFAGAVPVACRLAAALESIDDLPNRRSCTPGGISGVWKVRYFDPRRLAVSSEPPPEEDRYVLFECQHPNRSIWQHFVFDREENRRLRVADRQLGRWFVRKKALPQTPIPVCRDSVFVPLELRLPAALERAMVLSSGVAPVLKRFEAGRSPFINPQLSRNFGIPNPPARPVDWLVSKPYCTGNYCWYEGVHETVAWRKGTPIPMLGLKAALANATGLEGR